MTGHCSVIAQAKALVEVTLAHIVQIGTHRPAFTHRAVQQFTADPGVHRFQITAIDHAIQVLVQFAGLVQLQGWHGHV